MTVAEAIRERHPFTWARINYLRNRITADQAIGMVARDREFIAEAALNGETRIEAAQRVVLNVWRPELVERLQGRAA